MNNTIIIADDHAVLRQGLKTIIDSQPEFSVIGEAENGKQAVELIKSKKPDMVILDIDMPEMDGIDAARLIKENDKNIKIIILTMHAKHDYIFDALSLGINGYIFKMAESGEVLKALRTIADGEDYFAKEVSNLVLSNYSKYHKEEEKKEQPLVTNREKEIIALIAEGLTYKKIAEKLFISQFTVINHRQNIMQKLKLGSNAELIRFAIENGIVSSNPK